MPGSLGTLGDKSSVLGQARPEVPPLRLPPELWPQASGQPEGPNNPGRDGLADVTQIRVGGGPGPKTACRLMRTTEMRQGSQPWAPLLPRLLLRQAPVRRRAQG
jgi:hypothetical protein